MVDAALARFGQLDVLVNNAGIAIIGNIETATLDDWRKTQAVNSESVFLGCREAVRAMKAARRLDRQYLLRRRAHRRRAIRRLLRQQRRGAADNQIGRALLRAQGLWHPLQFRASLVHPHGDG